MKKLMIAALAVASCTAFAGGGKIADNAVYNLSFTTKYLDYNSKAYNWKDFTEKTAKTAKYDFPDLQVKETKNPDDKTGYYQVKWAEGDEGYDKVLKNRVKGVYDAEPNCRDLFKRAISNIQEQVFGDVQLVVTDYKETIKKIDTWYCDKSGARPVAKKGAPAEIVTKITFKYQDLSKSKVVSKNLSGVVIVDNGKAKSFIWDPQEKADYVNEFAGSTYNKQKGEWKSVKIANASKAEGEGFKFKPGMFSADNNAEGGFGWDIGIGGKNPACGWGTGKVALDGIAKSKDAQDLVYSSLQGGYAGSVDMDHMLSTGEYGTWKLSYDKASTQILRIKTPEDARNSNVARRYPYPETGKVEDYNRLGIPESYVEILGKKKVEIVD